MGVDESTITKSSVHNMDVLNLYILKTQLVEFQVHFMEPKGTEYFSMFFSSIPLLTYDE